MHDKTDRMCLAVLVIRIEESGDVGFRAASHDHSEVAPPLLAKPVAQQMAFFSCC